MLNRDLSWSNLKALHQLYTKKETRAKILSNPYIQSLKDNRKIIRYKMGNHSILQAASAYKSYYEINLLDDFVRYSSFLKNADINDDGKRHYSEYDLQTLMFIWDNRDELKTKLTTIRQFSATLFKIKGSKYLENRESLKNAVCKILEINDFPEKESQENQWRFVIDCINPKIVVLCENLAFLKQPWKARQNQIELWYVGGNNTAIINFISIEKLALPLYYSCDWDFAGLQIYSRIKRIIEEKGYRIDLLNPNDTSLALPTTSFNHASRWNSSSHLSNLIVCDFSDEQKSLINLLIQNDQWIEEESQDLIELIKFNKALN